METPEHQADRFFNRELSWLDFNERVLALAESAEVPVLDRARFLAIFATNLDEFFMVRVAGLKRQEEAGIGTRSIDGQLPQEQLAAISKKVSPLALRHAELFTREVMPALAESGIRLLRWKDLDLRFKNELNELFRERIFPVVTPLAVDPGHPFPYISNLSLNLAVLVRDRQEVRIRFARVKVPPLFPRFIGSSEQDVFVPIEDVIAANLDMLFPGMEIVEHHAFRVTRNADVEVDDDDAEDLLRALEDQLSRRRFSPAVRLEVEADMPSHVLDLLMREMQVSTSDVHALPGPLDLQGLFGLYELDRPELKDAPFTPRVPPDLAVPEDGPLDIFKVLQQKDLLVHHPYDSFASSVEAFIQQAASDPDVLAIKQTLYRTSGQSTIVDALIEAAREGKQVVVLVEIKARFDELANISWARALEEAGCHVVYGLIGLKTHCKLCLVVRGEGDAVKRYVHVGTGNYNPRTARIYEDIGLLTADADLGADVGNLFNYLTGYSRHRSYKSLLVAPHGLREQILRRIDREADLTGGRNPGRIVMKMNSLVDEEIIEALYKASAVGVQIDLLVRSICSLRPGVPGFSENIRVRSILGRFLEHSRIYHFANGGEPEVFIGSADMMHRNLDRRVEALVQVRDPSLQESLHQILRIALRDNAASWLLNPDGNWERIEPADGERRIDLQKELMARAGVHA